jgi:MerR family transcriptional regulator, heat shock protein HspR
MVAGNNDARGEQDRGVYVISVAAELAGVHPQTLRMYERKGLIRPKRTSGNSRLYSQSDVDWVRQIQRLTQDEGVNLAGVRMIMELRDKILRMQTQLERSRKRAFEQLGNETRSLGPLVRLRDVEDIFQRRVRRK